VSPDHRFSNSLLVQLACQSASALPRVPSFSLPSMAALSPSMGANTLFEPSLRFDVEDFPDEIGEISPFGIVGHLFQMLNGRMQNLVHAGFRDLIDSRLLLGREILEVPPIAFNF